MQADRHVERDEAGEKGESEEEPGSYVGHSLIPFFIHSRTMLIWIGCVEA